jgi:hypothetical protein
MRVGYEVFNKDLLLQVSSPWDRESSAIFSVDIRGERTSPQKSDHLQKLRDYYSKVSKDYLPFENGHL